MEEGLEIAFSHRSFQEYFVALHISSAQPEIQEKLIQRYLKNITSDNVIGLLLEINPELIERLVLLPQLKSIFSSIGVKRKVGITHATKYIKKAYRSLNVEPNIFSATVSKTNPTLSAVIHMAVKHCQTYNFPTDDYFDKQNKDMFKKFGKKEARFTYPTNALTYRTPIIVDTLHSKGIFSIEYLQAAFDTYKKLNLKHKNRSQNLDELLGISD